MIVPKKNAEETYKINEYICTDTNTEKDCNLFQDRPVLWSGRKPHDK
jgi:hypothetical protein